jgi:hypothetical protein
MPAFGDTNSLTQQEISNIEAYILAVNGVDRARLNNPGIPPMGFFMGVSLLYGMAALILAGIWSKREGGEKP